MADEQHADMYDQDVTLSSLLPMAYGGYAEAVPAAQASSRQWLGYGAGWAGQATDAMQYHLPNIGRDSYDAPQAQEDLPHDQQASAAHHDNLACTQQQQSCMPDASINTSKPGFSFPGNAHAAQFPVPNTDMPATARPSHATLEEPELTSVSSFEPSQAVAAPQADTAPVTPGLRAAAKSPMATSLDDLPIMSTASLHDHQSQHATHPDLAAGSGVGTEQQHAQQQQQQQHSSNRFQEHHSEQPSEYERHRYSPDISDDSRPQHESLTDLQHVTADVPPADHALMVVDQQSMDMTDTASSSLHQLVVALQERLETVEAQLNESRYDQHCSLMYSRVSNSGSKCSNLQTLCRR